MALFPDSVSAALAAREVRALGVGPADLSVVAADHEVEGAIANQIGGSPGSEIEDSSAASRLGELGGYILAAIAIGLPGTGSLVAAGPLAAELGEAAGHAAGDLKETLTTAGLSEGDADDWETRIRSKRAVLLGVHARTVSAARVEAILAGGASGGRVITAEWD